MLEEFYKNKKVLITGHTGFKGSWLNQILINWGAQVIGYSLEPNTKPALFDILGLSKCLEHHLGDIRDYQNLKKVIAQAKPEIVFHLAAQPLVRESYDDPLYTFQTNIMGTANLLQAVEENEGVKAVVIVTTDKVYRNQEDGCCFKENDSLAGHDPYSASKAGAEIVVESYLKSFFNPQHYNVRHQTLIASSRAGNVIGGGDRSKDRLMTDIIRAVFEYNTPISIRNPEAIRPWQHVLEPLFGYLLLAEKLYQGQGKFSGPWNFGPNEESFLTVEEILKKAITIMKKGSYIIEKDDQKHEATLLKLDIKKAKDILKWQPIFDIDKALNLTFNWYKSFYNKENVIDLINQQMFSFFASLK
ncbi:MAG: CDP-glucose 4,6-dehydratase [Candidatus Falkowbacteria bacterium]|nr:CDP-glucose 4,6-dehydratase [Candidatus Falkowbacteria bacterium]